MFCLISGAHSGPISRIWSGTHPGFEIVFFFSPAYSNYARPLLAMAGHGRPWPAVRQIVSKPFNTILKSWMGPGRDPDQIWNKSGKSAQNGPRK